MLATGKIFGQNGRKPMFNALVTVKNRAIVKLFDEFLQKNVMRTAEHYSVGAAAGKKRGKIEIFGKKMFFHRACQTFTPENADMRVGIFLYGAQTQALKTETCDGCGRSQNKNFPAPLCSGKNGGFRSHYGKGIDFPKRIRANGGDCVASDDGRTGTES